ncbi:protein inturned [Tachyglossus aculeatus]|uniref:protein inturned n=1 Tax=Tachyglossus aculeatus TaxID=9261 RepID=UPI0018F32136|nr:protein inturned [Tachyglossus aculeatus]
MAAGGMARAQRGAEEEEERAAGDSWDSGSGSYTDDSDDPEPEWTSSVRRNGELFYVELSGSEAESSLPEAPAADHPRSHGDQARGPRGAAGDGGRPRGPLRRWAEIFRPKSPRPHRKDVRVAVDVGPGAAPGPLEGLTLGAGGPEGGGGPLVVRGLHPGWPAGKTQRVLIGDVLVSINDVDVNSENLERILSHIPRPAQVKLTFETPAPGPEETIPEKKRAAQQSGRWGSARLLGGEEEPDEAILLRTPHIVMYLTLQLGSDTAKEEQEILYYYPDTEASQKLKSVRGIFLTLSDMLENVTQTLVTSSSLILSGKLVHVTYWKESGRLLIIGLPDEKAPLPQLKNMMNAVVQTLKFMYGSLDSAFCPEENVPSLDHLFHLFFQGAVLGDRHRGPALLNDLPGAHWLPLPQEVKMEIDTELSELEAADFGELSEDYYDMRRLYMILGSALFYKGYLIGSHLPQEDLVAVAGYCRLWRLLLLSATRRISRLVIWREIFRPRHFPDASAEASREPEARRFLLVVGLDHFLLCVVLEAGGCGTPGPDPVYVDQARAGLRRLRRLADPPSRPAGDGPDPRQRELPKGGKKKPTLPNPFQPGIPKKVLPERETEISRTTRLTSGPADTLFHYVLLETTQGVFVASTSEETPHLGSAVTPQLMTNFSRCTISIHSLFQESLRRQKADAVDARADADATGAGPRLDAVREHGVLFECPPPDWPDPKKPPPVASYWVVGRLLRHPRPQELYVCFHESVPEIAVEVAFKLSFGLTL